MISELKSRVRGRKRRKTSYRNFPIDNVLIKRLDDFAYESRLKKADIIHLALEDFISKYDVKSSPQLEEIVAAAVQTALDMHKRSERND